MSTTATTTTTTVLSKEASSSFESFVVTNAPEQTIVQDNQIQIPFVLTPPTPCLQDATAVAQWVGQNRAPIDAALNHTGVVLFRGFPLKSAEDFNTFVNAFDGWRDLSYDKSMSFAVRKRCTDRICTTNEGKSGGLVFHHEQAQTPLWPSHVFFCCLLPAQPGDGGATGLTPSDVVYSRLQQKYPDFCAQCEQEGVQYTVYAGPTQDASKGAGRSWKSFFHAATREDCERKMKAGEWTWEWGVAADGSKLADDFLKCTTPVLDVVKTVNGRKCFFNQLIATTANALEFSRVNDTTTGTGFDPTRDVPTQQGIDACVRFAKGDYIPLEILLDAKRICEELAVDVQWQKGDVALISNYLLMHARRPWKGPEGTRKLLASLVQEENCTSFGKKLVVL